MATTTTREDWTVWSCEASVVVTHVHAAPAADLVRGILREVDQACSRFRTDSELTRRAGEFARGAQASPMLAYLVRSALAAADLTHGDVDPTLATELTNLGYDRDISALDTGTGTGTELTSAPVATTLLHRTSLWRGIELHGDTLTIPSGVRLDLGASAKSAAADLAAARVAAEFGGGVLVALGGDIATSGAEPAEGWDVLVQDTEADPSQQVSLTAGAAMATSSTQKRRWMSGGYLRHHILDPRSGLPAAPAWRSVTVAADSCLRANAFSTASIVRGFRAVEWLDSQNIGARFVDLEGRVVTTGQWPTPVELLERAGGPR